MSIRDYNFNPEDSQSWWIFCNPYFAEEERILRLNIRNAEIGWTGVKPQWLTESEADYFVA